MPPIKFPSIELFNNIYKSNTREGISRPTIVYGAKIKLHGKNAAIRVSPIGGVSAQSRAQEITPADDLDQFAEIMTPDFDTWSRAAGPETLTFYGEWAGPGINKGDAIQQTDRKRFFIFALGIGEAPHHRNAEITVARWLITDPKAIRSYMPAGLCPDRVRVLPWELAEAGIVMDFADSDGIGRELDAINMNVDAVAEEDPYVAREFGIRKGGEGYVLCQIADAPGQLSHEAYSRTSFKAKTEKHRVRKQGKPASPKEPLPRSAHEFLDTFVTAARLTQAIDETATGNPDVSHTGKVIAWMVADISKEARDEIEALEAAGVPSKRLTGEISRSTREQFFARLKAS